MYIGTIGTMIGHYHPTTTNSYKPNENSPVRLASHQNKARYGTVTTMLSKPTSTLVECHDPPLFIASESFVGRKPGYKFATGERGMGYYTDLVQVQPSSWQQKRNCNKTVM